MIPTAFLFGLQLFGTTIQLGGWLSHQAPYIKSSYIGIHGVTPNLYMLNTCSDAAYNVQVASTQSCKIKMEIIKKITSNFNQNTLNFSQGKTW